MENVTNNEVLTNEVIAPVESAEIQEANNATAIGTGFVKAEMTLGAVAIVGWVVKGGFWVYKKVKERKALKAAMNEAPADDFEEDAE